MNFLKPITGSFACPAAENPTVVMIEAAYKQLGLDWLYVNLEVSPYALADAVHGAKAMGWRGFNCSIPHKVAVISHLDELGKSARLIGAVNTIVRQGDRWVGENTDGRGFVSALQKVISPKGKTIALLGAGGAARAVAVELALAGAKRILVINRSASRGGELVTHLSKHTSAASEFILWDKPFSVPEGVDILINATSIGLYPDVDGMPEIDVSSLSTSLVVADGIHNPPLTPFLKSAKQVGCQTVDGLEMLVQQGVLGVEYWTGFRPDASVMRAALENLHL
ncbi:shikimate dehydrogenase [Leeia sp. TBRC 13508]|uniref:Shikimate dehydrogenase (NADP(+)) n=1 Tax=Leeia speluncae TaxID=2884804 RepID=A0ABS8D1I3_9NEIS|nr:shikimate dehydrogenase [Leeia speluncae]MCB6182056.1 shikimate dehydrogenase [Leeia speluncae]